MFCIRGGFSIRRKGLYIYIIYIYLCIILTYIILYRKWLQSLLCTFSRSRCKFHGLPMGMKRLRRQKLQLAQEDEDLMGCDNHQLLATCEAFPRNGKPRNGWFIHGNPMKIWLVVSTNPSEKWWTNRQLGWWHSQYMEKPEMDDLEVPHFRKPPCCDSGGNFHQPARQLRILKHCTACPWVTSCCRLPFTTWKQCQTRATNRGERTLCKTS